MYILFEGIDTTGKTTQINKLKSTYPKMISTKEPGGTDFGMEIRSMLLEKNFNLSANAEMMLFLADRAEHYEKIIKPNSDKLIVSDRGFISGLSYAITNYPDIDLDYLISLNKFVLNGRFPEKVVFFKTTLELLSSRIKQKQHDNIEKRGFEYLLNVQDNMEYILSKLNIDYITLHAHLAIEELHVRIKGFIND